MHASVCAGPEEATVHILPQIWFRNTWSWQHGIEEEATGKPTLRQDTSEEAERSPNTVIEACHDTLGDLILAAEPVAGGAKPEAWFTENATNYGAVFDNPYHGEKYSKDAFHRHLVNEEEGAVNPDKIGTKACVHYKVTCKPGESKVVRLRLFSPAEDAAASADVAESAASDHWTMTGTDAGNNASVGVETRKSSPVAPTKAMRRTKSTLGSLSLPKKSSILPWKDMYQNVRKSMVARASNAVGDTLASAIPASNHALHPSTVTEESDTRRVSLYYTEALGPSHASTHQPPSPSLSETEWGSPEPLDEHSSLPAVDEIDVATHVGLLSQAGIDAHDGADTSSIPDRRQSLDDEQRSMVAVPFRIDQHEPLTRSHTFPRTSKRQNVTESTRASRFSYGSSSALFHTDGKVKDVETNLRAQTATDDHYLDTHRMSTVRRSVLSISHPRLTRRETKLPDLLDTEDSSEQDHHHHHHHHQLESQYKKFTAFQASYEKRLAEASEFFNACNPGITNSEHRLVLRQAHAGMMWTKQFYFIAVDRWLEGDLNAPDPPEKRKSGRNAHWKHLYNREIISMPDKWEYPWYASWDLAFHMIPIVKLDPDFAKEQLILFLREWYNFCIRFLRPFLIVVIYIYKSIYFHMYFKNRIWVPHPLGTCLLLARFRRTSGRLKTSTLQSMPGPAFACTKTPRTPAASATSSS